MFTTNPFQSTIPPESVLPGLVHALRKTSVRKPLGSRLRPKTKAHQASVHQLHLLSDIHLVDCEGH